MKETKKFFYDKRLLILFADLLGMCGTLFLAFLIRFDFQWSEIPRVYIDRSIRYLPVYLVVTVVIYYFMHLYSFIWRFVGIRECARICIAVTMSFFANLLLSIITGNRMPLSIMIMAGVLNLVFAGGMRFSYRAMRVLLNVTKNSSVNEHNCEHVMVIGAGVAGRTLIKEYVTSPHLNAVVCCVIDDSPTAAGKYIVGVPVVGNRDMILFAVKKYGIHTIIFAIPSVTTEQRRDILNICQVTKCKLKIIPGVYQLVNGEVSVSKLREVSIEDLLGRDSIKVNLNEIMGYVENKVILVTGGGGSIGSELCRQIACHNPRQLIIFDIYENNAYDIQQELEKTYPQLNLKVLIGSVRNVHRLEKIFEKYQPHLVYHAAAHKHVPLMEDSPNEAIKNNVFGTYNAARCAGKYAAEKFVLISTDKAVNPTNIMGASKRLCEMVVQAMNKEYKTEFVAVRFGNVLGSNGSVIPLFKKQILQGGPVTVTHPDIIRYFMTIPEAVSLVLQAGAYAKGGEIFVLDMGQPVKIADLARNLIRLSGFTPDVDIKIEYTGLRPGEKLYEELLMKEEGLKNTENKLIFIGKPIVMDEKKLWEDLEELYQECYEDSDKIRQEIMKLVPTYHPRTEEV